MFNTNYADFSIAHYKMNDYHKQAERDRQAKLAQIARQTRTSYSTKTVATATTKEVKVS